MQLPNPSPTSGPDFDPLATCRELAQLALLNTDSVDNALSKMQRVMVILSELALNPALISFPPEAQHNLLREGPSPENPTEGGQDQMSFFDSIPD